ncbi:MAG TPA: hypothetical protein VFN61_03500 [Acidimicrobiales bacterium]|nr:hypothetical protein [Acidimicrobiales bacterium]
MYVHVTPRSCAIAFIAAESSPWAETGAEVVVVAPVIVVVGDVVVVGDPGAVVVVGPGTVVVVELVVVVAAGEEASAGPALATTPRTGTQVKEIAAKSRRLFIAPFWTPQ